MGSIPKLNEARKFKITLFDDHVDAVNAMGRTYRFYEFNGWLKRAFGDKSRMGVYKDEIENIDQWFKYSSFPEYNFSQVTPKKTSVIGTVTISSKSPAEEYSGSKIALVLKRLFYPREYFEIRDNFIRIKFEEHN